MAMHLLIKKPSVYRFESTWTGVMTDMSMSRKIGGALWGCISLLLLWTSPMAELSVPFYCFLLRGINVCIILVNLPVEYVQQMNWFYKADLEMLSGPVELVSRAWRNIHNQVLSKRESRSDMCLKILQHLPRLLFSGKCILLRKGYERLSFLMRCARLKTVEIRESPIVRRTFRLLAYIKDASWTIDLHSLTHDLRLSCSSRCLTK
jgi:hypothetical protein